MFGTLYPLTKKVISPKLSVVCLIQQKLRNTKPLFVCCLSFEKEFDIGSTRQPISYFCPSTWQFTLPIPNGMSFSLRWNLPSSSRNLSGLNCSGFGHSTGSMCTFHKLVITMEPFGMLYLKNQNTITNGRSVCNQFVYWRHMFIQEDFQLRQT